MTQLVTVTTKSHNTFNGWQPCAPPKHIDWHDSSDRKWLMNHMHHCMLNGKQVTLNPTEGDSNHAD